MKNDITGDEIRSRPTTTAYKENWEKIFGKKTKKNKKSPSLYSKNLKNR